MHSPGKADLNLYAYVSGRALQNVDPLGLDPSAGEKQYQYWSQAWADEANIANQQKQGIEAKFNDDPHFGAKLNDFRHGNRDALGPEYRAAADRYDRAMFYVGQFANVHDWLLMRVDVSHLTVTQRQIDAAAEWLAKKDEVVQALLGAAIGIASTRAPSATFEESAPRASPEVAQAEAAGEMTGCFAPTTVVITEDGYLPISQVAPGERVWSFNDEAAQWEWSQVDNVLLHAHEGVIVTIETADAAIKATPNHPFCLEEGRDKDRRPAPRDIPADELSCSQGGRWVEAGDLLPGDQVAAATSRIATLLRITKHTTSEQVYNLQVAGTHTYAVSEDGLLVHNKGARARPNETFIRYGSADEAAATKDNGLAPRPGHSGPKRVADANAVIKAKALGKPKQYSHKMTFEVDAGTRQWLRQWEIEGEPGRYAIPEDQVQNFNDRIHSIKIEKVR
jgi:hypothetical protein